MPTFKIAPFRYNLSQSPSISIPDPVPPPEPTFTGIPGVIEGLATISILSASAWAGIKVGISKSTTPTRVLGWTGGLGSALLAILYVGTKIGIAQDFGFPAVRVTPS